MTEYILEVYSLDSTTGTYTREGELSTYFDLNWNKKSNKPSFASFKLNVYSPDGRFAQPFKNWILIKRNGIAEFFGNIINVRGNVGTDTGSISVDCADILYSLYQLYTEGRYVQTNTDAGTIASALVALAQAKTNANFGIQNGTIQTVGTSNETLFYQSIGKALTNQADNIIGYDFTFVPILDADGKLDYIQFNVFTSIGVVRDNLPPFELGYSVNILEFGMGDEVYNKIYTLGSDTGDVEVAESENTTSQNIFALREKVNKESSIQIKETLQSKGDDYLNRSQGVRLELGFQLTEGIKPYYGDFGLMDTLSVNIDIGDTFFNFKGTAQVRELIFDYDNQTNKETITPIIEYYKT